MLRQIWSNNISEYRCHLMQGSNSENGVVGYATPKFLGLSGDMTNFSDPCTQLIPFQHRHVGISELRPMSPVRRSPE